MSEKTKIIYIDYFKGRKIKSNAQNILILEVFFD